MLEQNYHTKKFFAENVLPREMTKLEYTWIHWTI